ncbi:MAG: type II toxin-antitoxin system VapC family toxin [Proteobacteria bacterium]|nr:type II toxin-antitoxin system VapC family toxin [Pseudomonadota bacterium]
MILVVDASVVIKWFVEEPLRPQARALLADRHEFIAPDLMIPEVANIAWKKATRGEIQINQARSIIRSIVLPPFMSTFVESAALRERAFALALQWKHPVYDCFYAACAEAVTAPLISADEKFLRLVNARGSSIRGISLARLGELVNT